MYAFGKNTQNTSISLPINLHLLLLVSISITLLPLASQGCHEEERKALLQFKAPLRDPANYLSSWQEGSKYQNCCAWHGIQCSSDSFHIISINLRNTEYENYFNQVYYGDDLYHPSTPNTTLQGKFSPSLSVITHLEYLDLGFNDFQDSKIPLQISNLRKLTHLGLSNSNFSGSISTQFTNLSSLEYLDLSCIHGDCLHLPSTKWLKGLVNLQVLRLSGIDLYETKFSHKNFVEHLSYFSSLRDLDLYECNISGPVFPIHEFNNLSRLSYLNMGYNRKLHSPFPVHLTNLTSLSTLILYDCKLHGLVPYIPQLKELDVDENRDLRVNLTRMFEQQWPKLQILGITAIKVTGSFQKLISNAPLLETLYAADCSIQGSIPKSICKLSFLQGLYLLNNNFTGTIPNCFTTLRNLKEFNIRNNSIEGNVSLTSLINQINPIVLDLSSNRLTGVIDLHLPLHQKYKLEKLELGSNNLKGLFPTSICNLTSLVNLDLSDNNLTGTIPTNCFEKLNNISILSFSHNNLYGPLPTPCQNSSLYDLAHNSFSGEISIEMGKRLSTVSVLNLSGNKLTSSVPHSICSKEPGLKYQIQYLDLSNNKLSGTIPSSIGYCRTLLSLNLGANKLTGNVPNELGDAKILEYLQLNDNNLGGTLNFIGKLQELEVLNLGNNNFEGNISTVFVSLHGLKILSLRSNKFSGMIPKEITHFHYLQILDLSRNNLTGLIPTEIGNLKMLTGRPNGPPLLVDLYSPVELHLQIVIKGIMMQLEKLYTYNSGIDLSCNVLEGNIPETIGLLKGLSMLNLSHNQFSGTIPSSVGSMHGLESLDLSFNKLCEHIPQSLASIDSLGYLNVSYNNLSGRIPRGPHFDTLSGDGSAYYNNTFLCGYLTQNTCECNEAHSPSEVDAEEEDESTQKCYFYGVIFLGFIIGFWGLFFGLLLKKDKWWFGYWRFVDIVAVRIARLFLKDP